MMNSEYETEYAGVKAVRIRKGMGIQMKRRVLLAGKNHVVMDEFFYNMSESLECQTTTIRAEDISCHVKYFKPELFVYCLKGEDEDVGIRLSRLLTWMQRRRIPYAIVGDRGECDTFCQCANVKPALVLTKPISANQIEWNITKYLSEKDAMEAQVELELENEKAPDVQEALPRRKHVTVVDDDPRMLKLIKEYLHEDYDVAVAVSGKIALRFLETKVTDIILLDYVMPEEDGPMIFEKNRNIPEHSDTPIVFLTGISERDKIQKVMLLHPQGYLLKPVEKDRLLSTIQEIIG